MKRLFLPALIVALITPAHALIDTDSDGLGDVWEAIHGFQIGANPPANQDPLADPDGDGFTNLAESGAGTDPLESKNFAKLAFSLTLAAYEPLPPGSAPPPSSPPPTDPFDPNYTSPAPAIPRILLDPPVSTLTWPTVPGKSYEAFPSENLAVWPSPTGAFLGAGIPHTLESESLYPDGTVPPKLFWRVQINDTDSDLDTLTDYEELHTSDPTSPGKTLDPFNPDTDGDGILDNLDASPFVNSLQAVWNSDSVDPAGAALFASFNFTPAAGSPGRIPDISGHTRHATARFIIGAGSPLPLGTSIPPNAEGIASDGFRSVGTRHLAFEAKNPGINFQPVGTLSFWLKTKASDLIGAGQPLFSYVPKNAVFNQFGNTSNPYAVRAYLRKQPIGEAYEIVWYDWRNPGGLIRERWNLSMAASQLDGTWVNLTFVWQGGGGAEQTSYWACYANGVMQTRTQNTNFRFQTSATTPNTAQDTFLIGADASGGNPANNQATVGATFKGTLDRIRLYSSGITDAQVKAIVSQDTDNDHLHDSTEVSTTTWKDTNGNGIREAGEIFFPNTNPIRWQPATTDTDRDGLTDLYEQNTTRTLLHNHDTDSDLLPDGWEHENNLNPLSAAGNNGTTGNADNDGLDNFDEWRFLTHPQFADTDGDGVNDGPEITQGSDPTSGLDNGQAPPPEEKLTLKILVGDPSTSHSERWRVEAEDIATGQTILRHASREYGQMSTAAESTFDRFKPGKAYRFKLRHAGTDPAKLAQDPEGTSYPDYDWSLQISYKDAQGNFIDLADPAQSKYLVLDPYNPDTKGIAQDTPKLLAPEDPWGTIGEGQDAKYDYEEKILPTQVVMLPVSTTAVSRDPDSGSITELGSITETSDPAPEILIEILNATITPTGGVSIQYSGKARDRISEIMHDPSRGVSRIDVYLDGVFLKSIAGFQPAPSGAAVVSPWMRRDSTIAFSDTVLIPDAAPGLRQLALVTNANVAGNKGFHGGSVLIEKQTHAHTPLASPPAFQLTLPDSFGSGADSLDLLHAGTTYTLTEEPETPDSAIFVGTVTLGSTPQTLGLQLPSDLVLSTLSPDSFVGEAIWQVTGGMNRIRAVWTETGAATRVFTQTSTLATADLWSNLAVAGAVLAQPKPPSTFNPFVIRMGFPESIEALGKKGLLTAEWDTAAANFRKPHGNIGEDPPEGMSYYYLSRGIEPRVFCLHPALAGGPHSPGDIIADNGIHLRFHPKHEPSKEFTSSTKPIEIVSAQPPLLQPPGALAAPPQASVAPVVAYSMEEVRLWFELLFDTAGKELLTRFETGTSGDRGVAISLQQLWAADKRPYKFQKTEPRYQDTGGKAERASLWINSRVCKSPVDAAVALYHALQELRETNPLWLRSGLVIDWTEVLDTYLQSSASDAEIEQALRHARLGPITATVTAAKDAYALGFSFVPGGELIVTSVDVEHQLVQGNAGSAALVGSALFAPRLLKIMSRYAGKTLKRWRWNLGELGDIEWDAAQLTVLENPVIFSLTASRTARMNALAPAIRNGTITPEQVEKLYNMGVLKIRSGTSRSQLRDALLAVGQNGNGKIAHHMLPIAAEKPKLELEFLQRGIDPNTADNGLFLTQQKHELIHGKGTTGWGDYGDPYLFQWDRFFKQEPKPNYNQTIAFREQLKSIIMQNFDNAENLPWPIPKTVNP